MSKMKTKGERQWIIASMYPQASTDKQEEIKDVYSDFTGSDLEQFKLDFMPMCRNHVFRHDIGQFVASYGGKNMPKLVVGYIDGEKDIIARYVIKHELMKPNGLKEMSLSFSLHQRRSNEHPGKWELIRGPLEGSLVKKGEKPNCRVIYTISESELKTIADPYITNLFGLNDNAPQSQQIDSFNLSPVVPDSSSLSRALVTNTQFNWIPEKGTFSFWLMCLCFSL